MESFRLKIKNGVEGEVRQKVLSRTRAANSSNAGKLDRRVLDPKDPGTISFVHCSHCETFCWAAAAVSVLARQNETLLSPARSHLTRFG